MGLRNGLDWVRIFQRGLRLLGSRVLGNKLRVWLVDELILGESLIGLVLQVGDLGGVVRGLHEVAPGHREATVIDLLLAYVLRHHHHFATWTNHHGRLHHLGLLLTHRHLLVHHLSFGSNLQMLRHCLLVRGREWGVLSGGLEGRRFFS